MSFLVRAVVPAQSVDRLSALAAMANCSGVAEVPDGPSVQVLVGFGTETAARRFVESIDPVRARIECPDGWVGARPVVVQRDNRRIELEVGTSFGDGAHPTTALALDALADLGPGAGRTLLDVGCGTGVLSIWAAAAGFVATGCDIDPASVARATANAASNRVSDRTRFVVGAPSGLVSDGSLPTGVSVAVVNTLIGVHEREGRAVLDALQPAGSLIVTGALQAQEHRLVAAYPGWRPVARRQRRGWVQLQLDSQ